MKNLEEIDFNTLLKVYNKYYTLNYLGNDINNKLACIALTCYLTNELRKKNKKLTCYEVLLKIGKDLPDMVKNTLLKSIGAISEDLMYGCDTFPDFGISPKEMPKTIQKILDNYCPF